MPIDLELERGADNFYNIVTAYPNRIKNIEGILIFDDSTHSPSVTATDSLVRLADDKSGVSYQGANAKTSIPSEGNIAQSEDGGNDISSDEQTQKILKLFRRNLITEKETIRKLADSFAERGINDSLKKAEDIFYKEFPKPETKIPNSVEQCKNFEDLKSFWEDGYNVRFDDALKKLNFDAVKETLSGFEKALKYFPNVISRLSFIEPQKLRYNELSVIPMRFSSSAAKIHVGLQLNETVFGEKLADYKERNFNSGVTNENFGNGAHEAGHFLTLALNHKLGMASLSKKIMDFIDNLLVNRAYESIKNKVDGKALAKLKADISAYALTVDKECIAEAVSDFISNSGNAQPLSKAIFQELKSALNSDKFINEEFLAMPPVINRAKPLYQMFFAHSVNKWINAKRKDGTYQNKTDKVRQIAENLLADRELADELKALRIKEFSGTDKWAELLDAHSFDEEILLSTDDWSDSRINEMAKHSPFRRAMELLGARFIEGKVYNLDDDTRGYIARLLDGYGNPITKFSGKGDLEKMFRAAKRLSENELDGKQKKWVEFGEDYGLNIVWLDAHKDLKGAVEGGTIYFNAKTNKDIFKTFWHEQFHMMSALNPELRDDLLKYFKKTFKAEQLDAYRKENKREDLSDKETIEEILSDNFEHVQSRVKTLREMAESPNLLKKFVAFVKNLMEKFVSIFRSPEGGMTREQRDDFIKRFHAMAANLRDIHGGKIFTTYKNGKELKHANGEKIKLVPLKFSAEKPVDNAEQKSDNTENDLTDEILKRLDNPTLIKQINDDMDVGEVREKLLRAENIAVGQLIKAFDRLSNTKGVNETKLNEVRENLREAVLNADDIRKAFNSTETLREVETALQRQNKGRKGSRLAETFQQQLDRGRIGAVTGRERVRVDQIPGEYRRMYEHEEVKKILRENANNQKHSEQGAFSIDEKISAAIEKDSTVKNAIATLGGEIVDGKLQADAKSKAKIEKFLDTLNEEGEVKYSIAWHGTPHDFDKFTLDAIGTGDGSQVHGWGLYFADDKAVSEGYKTLHGAKGRLYKVEIPDADVMIDEQKRWRNQPKKVKDGIKKLVAELSDKEIGIQSRETILDGIINDPIGRGGFIYSRLSHILDGQSKVSKRLSKYGVKGITYESERDGRCYVVFDDEAIQILEKYSKRGNGDTSIKNYVGDEKLNSQQKLIKAFSEKMGMPTIFFRNANKDFHGAHTNGITYLNVNSEVPLGKVFWHETLHWLSANNPRVFKQLSDAVNLSEEQLKNYLDETGREDLQKRGEITEEILADSLHKLLSEVKDKNLLQKVVAWIKDTLSKFKEMFRNPEGGLTTAQYKRLENAFGNMAKNLTDEDGNKIFRFNNRTKELELAGGEKLSTVPLTADDEQVSENTTIGNPNKNKVEIANGYYTESGKNLRASKANEFIVDSNGNENISAISETVAEKSNGEIKALPVRLKVGFHRSDTQNGNGYKHIAGKHLKEIRAHGFKNAMDFINYTLKNFDKAYKHPDKNNRIILFCDDDSRGFMPLQLIDEGNYYSIVTAFPKESKKINGELIFDRSETLSAVTADDTTKGKATDVAARTDNKGGVKSVAANVEINSPSENITQLEDNNKDEDTATVAKSLGGKLVNGEWTFDNEKSRRTFERHLQNVKNNFSGTKFSASNTVKKYAKKLGLTAEQSDRIITKSMEEQALREKQNQAIDEYLKEPSDENKQRLKDLKVKAAQIEARKNGREYREKLTIPEVLIGSPSRIAEKVAAFKEFFTWGDEATREVVRLRDKFYRSLDSTFELVSNKKDLEDFTDLLIFGDATQTEYGKLTDAEKNSLPGVSYEQARIRKVCEETGVSENVAKAYLKWRKLSNSIRLQMDKARRQPRKHSRHLTDKEIEKLRQNKFVLQETVKIGGERDEKGRRLVDYVEYANFAAKHQNVTQAELDKMKSDPAIQVTKVKETGEVEGEKIFEVETQEGKPPIANREGYFPHAFHEYMVRIKDKDGKVSEDYGYGGVIGSGNTQQEAIKFAEQWLKLHRLKDGENIYIAPKAMDFGHFGMSEEDYAPIMGDKDFDVMVHRIADNNEIKLKDAKNLVSGSVKFKNRHRFFGHLQERKGAKGYSTNAAWVLYHYAGQAARYIALESEFKPKAITLFERRFGAFEGDYGKNTLAKYTKDYINDVNGNPAEWENMLNEYLNGMEWYQNLLTPRYGDRAALTVTNNIVGLTSKTTLGVLNLSSAMLNLTQLANAASYLGGVSGAKRVASKFGDLCKRRGKLTFKERKILAEAKVLSDLGLDTASGYDRNRAINGENFSEDKLSWLWAKTNELLDKGMYLFQGVDMMCRISTTLAAYEKAIAEGKSGADAVEYAAEINRKANFDYSASDAPNIFRRLGVFGKIILQFQKFPIKMLEVFGDFAPWSKKTTFKQKATFWAMQFLMIGLLGLIPAFDWLDKMIYEHTEFSPKDFIQKKIMKYAPKPVGKILMYGGGSLANIDASTRIGTADIMPKSFTDFVMGATGSKIYNFSSSMFKALFIGEEGAYLNALRNISPGLYNIYSALAGETFTTRGRRNSIYEDLYDRLIRGIGFKSVDESLAADVQRITTHDRGVLNKEKQRAVDAYIASPTAENLKRVKELGIKPKTIKDERKRKQLDKLGRTDFGETKKERQQNQYLFDFAK